MKRLIQSITRLVEALAEIAESHKKIEQRIETITRCLTLITETQQQEFQARMGRYYE